MKFKSIPSAWMRRDGRRFDCGPYMSGALEAKIRLEQLACRKDSLASLCVGGADGIFHAGRESRNWVDDPDAGVPFLSSSSILASDLSGLPLISKRQVASNPRFTLRRGWTLITRSGTIGRMVYARPDMDGLACSEHVMRVVPDAEKVAPGFVYAFLSSKFGVPLVTSGTYGSIIQSIEPQHIADLPVPRLGESLERQVASLMDDAAQAAVDGICLHLKATARAFRACGLEPYTGQRWHEARLLTFVSSFSSLRSLRALNNDPRMVLFFDEVVRTNSFSEMGDLLSRRPFRPNRFKRIDAAPEFGVPLVGQREMFRLHWEGRTIAWSGIPDRNEVCAPTGTIAVACIGTLGENEVYGQALRVRPDQRQFALSDNVLQLRPNPDLIPPGYLFALLRSETYFRVFRCLSVGGKQQVLHPDLLSRVPVPLAAKQEMREVDALVVRGDDLLDTSVRKENEARALVERAIEEAN